MSHVTNAGTSAGFRLRGSIPPCRLRRRKLWKFDYEMVHSEVHVYLDKYVVSTAPFSTPACPDWSQNIKLTEKTALFACFLLFHFSSIFQGVQLAPFAPMCGRPWTNVHVNSGNRQRMQYNYNKKLSYRRATARCVLSVVILPITTQQCRNYLYDKSWPNR